MNRLLAIAALIALTSAAIADIAPPKGLKRVTQDNKITTAKDYPGYNFYIVSGDKAEAAKLDAKTPLVISGAGRGGRYGFLQLVAVPNGSAARYGSDKEFIEAIVSGKVMGMLKTKAGMSAQTTIKDSDARKTVVQEYTLESIDAKEGVVIKPVKGDAPKSAPPKEEEEAATALVPRGGVWVAGLAATASTVMGGFWIARRNRRSLA